MNDTIRKQISTGNFSIMFCKEKLIANFKCLSSNPRPAFADPISWCFFFTPWKKPVSVSNNIWIRDLQICLRASTKLSVIIFSRSPYKSSFEGSISWPVHLLNSAFLISTGEMLTFLRYWLIFSLLSVNEGKKSKGWKNHFPVHHFQL